MYRETEAYIHSNTNMLTHANINVYTRAQQKCTYVRIHIDTLAMACFYSAVGRFVVALSVHTESKYN